MPQFSDKHFIFVAGVHRSGTSLVHNTLREHPDITGFTKTGKPEDEGQHLQTVFPTAQKFGGPGRFAFNSGSFMDETHPLATPANACKIYADWKKHWDLKNDHLLEKSPPTIVRTRFFQQLFPNSSFVIVLRHPIPVAYATLKFCKASIFSLLEHTLRCYERFFADKDKIKKLFVARYENFVERPQQVLGQLHSRLGVSEHEPLLDVRRDRNPVYFSKWQSEIESLRTSARMLQAFEEVFAERMSVFGYSINSVEHISPVDWIDGEQI